jgi:hypothetical protein
MRWDTTDGSNWIAPDLPFPSARLWPKLVECRKLGYGKPAFFHSGR